MHDSTRVARDSGVSAASENHLEPVHPPSEMFTRRPGFAAFNLRSWLKLPRSGSPQMSATPSTLFSAAIGAP